MTRTKKSRILILILCLVMIFSLCSCGQGGGGTGQPDNPETEVMSEAPEISGLTFESEPEIDYAEQFKIYKYEGGYKFFHIVEGEDILLVPEGGTVPEGLDDSVIVLQAPVQNIYLAATAQMALFLSMDGTDSVRMVSLKQDGWTYDEPKQLLDQGKVVFAGKYSEPDYELLMDEGCGLAIESTMIYHTPEVKEMLEDLGIPVLVDRSSYESNPLGRTEWIKFYGELVGKETEANAFFEGQKELVSGLDDFPNTEKTVAFFYITTDGKANVRRADDYIPAMIEMAGGRYIFKDVVDESGRSTIPMTIEAFYDIARDADYIIYNASIDSSVTNLEELLAKDPILSEMKAVKENNCWSSGGSMYQRTDLAGDMIMDFHILFTDDDPEGKLKYITKLD